MAVVDDILEAQKIKIAANFADACFELHDAMFDRIFKKNIDINGNKPKPYDTDPISVSKKNYKNVRLGGKKSKTGKTHYFEGGYAQLKSESGRPPVELFGRLSESFRTGLREVNPLEYEISVPIEDSYKIKSHFVNFFKVSKTEKEELLKTINGQ